MTVAACDGRRRRADFARGLRIGRARRAAVWTIAKEKRGGGLIRRPLGSSGAARPRIAARAGQISERIGECELARFAGQLIEQIAMAGAVDRDDAIAGAGRKRAQIVENAQVARVTMSMSETREKLLLLVAVKRIALVRRSR